MSEADQQDTNGTANAAANGGDVPEIELIIKEEYICTNEALPDDTASEFESSNIEKDSIEEFIKVENEFLRELTEGCQESAYNFPSSAQEEAFTNKTPPDEGDTTSIITTNIAKNINRPSSASSSSAMEYAMAVAEACDEFDDSSNDNDDNDDNDIENNSDAGNAHEKIPIKIKKKARLPIDEEIMQKGIHAVLHEGLSITQAARKYNLVKSTLWMRVSKQPICPKRNRAHRPVIDSAICSKLLKGASLAETARSLCVSKATIYRHKQQLIEMGALNNEVLMNSPIRERYTQALRAYRVNGMSVRFAAKFFSLPHVSLWRYIKKNQSKPISENVAIKNEDRVSRLNDVDDVETNVLKEIQINAELNEKNQLIFEIDESFESVETSAEVSRDVKDEFVDHEDDMIFEDELLIRILK